MSVIKDEEQRYSYRNFFRYSVYRVTSLSGMGPIFIIASFIMASGYLSRVYLGIIGILILIVGISLEPLFGYAIDSFQRKSVLKFCIFATIILLSFSSLMALLYGTANLAVLSILLIGADTITSLVYSTQRVLQQSISRISLMGKNNGIAEITSQLPSMVGSIIAVPIIIYVGFFGAIVFAILISIISLILLSRIHEEKMKVSTERSLKLKILVDGYLEVFRFLKSNIKITLFIVTLNFTFICLMASNYLSPIYIYKVGGNAGDLAIVEILYSIFAIISGLIIPRLMERWLSPALIWVFMVLFATGNILIAMYNSLSFFMIVQPLFFGLGNPSTRMLRNTFVMERIPHEMSGKFFAGISLISNMARICIMIVMTSLINILPLQILWKINGALVLGAVIFSMYLSIEIKKTGNFIKRKDEPKEETN